VIQKLLKAVYTVARSFGSGMRRWVTRFFAVLIVWGNVSIREKVCADIHIGHRQKDCLLSRRDRTKAHRVHVPFLSEAQTDSQK
jgi:hypothetical protein